VVDLRHRERLQPSLLDRLTDDDPGTTQESRAMREFPLVRFRETVLRDLGWLLNTTNLSSALSLTAYPLVAESVLNFGVPELSGRMISTTDGPSLERALRQSIAQFEPRILPHTLKVRLDVNESQMSHNALTFLIEGDLWAQPTPLRLYLKTEIDLDLGDVRISPQAG